MTIHFEKALVLGLLSSMILTSCSDQKPEERKQQAVEVTVATAVTEPDQTIQASGKIASAEVAVISTRMMGFITGIKVSTGDRVRKGQLLATISSDDIVAKRAQAQAMVAESEAALSDAKKDYERYAELFKQQSASAKELENMELRYRSVKARTEASRQMQKEAEAMLAYSHLRAPFPGVVTQRNADEGSMASPGMPILVIEQADRFEVNTFVSERDISKVRTGAAAEVVIKASGQKLRGTVSEVSPSSGMNGGQYQVNIRLNEPGSGGLYGGMYAHVSIASAATPSTEAGPLLVPRKAIVQRDQLNGLYTISEAKTALLRWVTIGKSYGDQVEVLSGLNATEQFILSADGKLYNGVPVQVATTPLSDNR